MVGRLFTRCLSVGILAIPAVGVVGTTAATAAPCKNAVVVSDLGDDGGSRQVRAAIASSLRRLGAWLLS